ncbi:MAG: GNAT family N-acetyltransferase, partial [Gammaproteobacteria bacterium]
DYDRAMAFVAEATTGKGRRETLGVARAHADPDNHTAQFAVIVRSDVKGRGLGSILMEKLVRYCQSRGVRWITSEVLSDNLRMLQLSAAHGFKTEPSREGAVRVSLEVPPPERGTAGGRSASDADRSASAADRTVRPVGTANSSEPPGD